MDPRHPAAADEPAWGYPGVPLATASKACAIAQQGETILLRDGVYRETLRPASDGVTIRAMKDEKVTISGADEVAGWTREERTWWAPLSAEPKKLLRDGKPWSEFTYDAAAKRITVKTGGDPRLHLFETVVRESGIDLAGRKDVKVEGIEVVDTLGAKQAQRGTISDTRRASGHSNTGGESMKKMIGLCVAGLALAALCQAQTTPPAMTLTKMDEAKQKDWLARWDKEISGEAKGYRTCDSAMGEDIAWGMTPVMDGFYYGYMATKNTKYVDMLVDWADSLIKRAVKEPDGYVGWPSKGAAGTAVDNLDDYNADSMLSDAMVFRPIVLMAGEMIKNPALKEKYGAKGESYLKLAEQLYAKWVERGGWRETKDGGMISVVLPYGMDAAHQKWIDFDTRNDPGHGFSHPDNKANEVARWMLAMWDVTGKPEYKERAEKWFKLLKSRMKPKSDGTYEIWNYWQPAGPWDYKPDGSPSTGWASIPTADITAVDTAGDRRRLRAWPGLHQGGHRAPDRHRQDQLDRRRSRQSDGRNGDLGPAGRRHGERDQRLLPELEDLGAAFRRRRRLERHGRQRAMGRESGQGQTCRPAQGRAGGPGDARHRQGHEGPAPADVDRAGPV